MMQDGDTDARKVSTLRLIDRRSVRSCSITMSWLSLAPVEALSSSTAAAVFPGDREPIYTLAPLSNSTRTVSFPTTPHRHLERHTSTKPVSSQPTDTRIAPSHKEYTTLEVWKLLSVPRGFARKCLSKPGERDIKKTHGARSREEVPGLGRRSSCLLYVWHRAKGPGRPLLNMNKTVLMSACLVSWPLVMHRGEGSLLWTDQVKSYNMARESYYYSV